MVNVNVEIPDEIHRQVKVASILNNVTLREQIIRLLEEELKKK